MQPQEDPKYLQYCEKIVARNKNQLVVNRRKRKIFACLSILFAGLLGGSMVAMYHSSSMSTGYMFAAAAIVSFVIWAVVCSYLLELCYLVSDNSKLTDADIIFRRCLSYEDWQKWKQSEETADKLWRQSKEIAGKLHGAA